MSLDDRFICRFVTDFHFDCLQKRHGQGDYTYAAKGTDEEPIQYKGAWVDNQKHGIGKQMYAKVGEYYGYWESGNRHGEGVMTYLN